MKKNVVVAVNASYPNYNGAANELQNKINEALTTLSTNEKLEVVDIKYLHSVSSINDELNSHSMTAFIRLTVI